MKKCEFVTFEPFLLSPCAKLPNHLPKAVVHTSFISGFLCNVVYLEMNLTVVGLVNGAQKCSIFIGFAVVAGVYFMGVNVNIVLFYNH